MAYKMINTVGEPWSGVHESLMEFYCTYIHAEWNDSHYTEIITVSSVMLSYGEIGNSIYDIMVLLSTGKGNYESKMLPIVQKFCRTNKVFDFVKTIRNILFDDRFDNAYGISSLLTVGSLLAAGYNLGTITGVSSEEKLVVVSDELDVLQIETVLVVMLNEKVRSELPQHIRLSEKKQTKFMKYFSKRDTDSMIEMFRSFNQKLLTDYFNGSRASSKYSYFNNFYNEISDDFFIHNDIAATAAWGREDTHEPTSKVIRFYKSMFSRAFFDDDLLKKREIYVRDNGVRLKFNKPEDGIESISLREFHTFDPHEEHLLLITYHTEEGVSRLLPVDLTSLDKSFIPIQYELDVSVLLMVYTWLGVVDKTNTTVEKLLAFGASKEDAESILDSKTNFLKFYSKMMSDDNLTYVVPFHWNYSGHSKKYERRGGEPLYAEKMKKIGRYTRKLPVGQKASDEAKTFAKRVFIELEEGMTLVEEFERRQRVRLK